MVSDSERTKILEMIEEGTITAEEGLILLNALDGSPLPEDTTVEEIFEDEELTIPPESDNLIDLEAGVETPFFDTEEGIGGEENNNTSDAYYEEAEIFDGDVEVMPPDPAPPSAEEIKRWKRWWVIPLWIGAGITVIGGLLMYWAFSANGFGFWFACAWFPFLLGVALLALAWSSRTAPWLHVRVHQAPGEKPQRIAISLPIPVHLTAWGLRTFGHHIPNIEGTNLDEVILALKDVSKDGTPLFVDVDEGEDGERVQVFIG
jgi:hypothetical protein